MHIYVCIYIYKYICGMRYANANGNVTKIGKSIRKSLCRFHSLEGECDCQCCNETRGSILGLISANANMKGNANVNAIEVIKNFDISRGKKNKNIPHSRLHCAYCVLCIYITFTQDIIETKASR